MHTLNDFFKTFNEQTYSSSFPQQTVCGKALIVQPLRRFLKAKKLFFRTILARGYNNPRFYKKMCSIVPFNSKWIDLFIREFI